MTRWVAEIEGLILFVRPGGPLPGVALAGGLR
jgi:hypothetical protein